MIDILFNFGNEIILVKIEGNRVLFGNTIYGAQLATIDGLQLSRKGVEKEFPDLVGDDNWAQEAANRFKKKLKSFRTEEEVSNYIIEDLKGHGYIPWKIQKGGHRPMKL